MTASLNLVKMESMTVDSLIKVEFSELNKEETLKAFQSTQKSYKRTKTITVLPSPIPAQQCVPTMASVEQMETYQSQFTNVLNGYLGIQSIGDLLRIFSYSDTQIPIGKISFLGSFFKKIQELNINLDVAILCNDLQSQNKLLPILQAINLNCDHLTSYPVKRDTFGVIVKIRKAAKPITTIKKATSVDIVMVYDSAINVYNRVLDQFSGVNYDNPQVVYISTLDSGDIRCYSSSAHEELSWDTLYKNVDIAQHIFHQVNRRSTLEAFLVWNNYVASEVAEWAAKKDNTPYIFYQPTKKSMPMQVYRLWNGGHPLSHSPKKPSPGSLTSSKKTAVPQAAKTNSAPTKVKQRSKRKKQQGCISSSKAPASSNAGAIGSPSPTFPTYLATKHTSEASTTNVTSNVSVHMDASASTACSDESLSILSPPGQKRSIKVEENSLAKKSKTSDRFLSAFDFSSILDEAMQQFEEQLNSMNVKI
ncbi:hypothetical protein BD408DRAFT_447569 [Parasitella parasitica]|nr:hypothetical protein BD408DRAFT_447569 [Parasitella parasitica]